MRLTEKEFKELSSKEQWEWVLNHKNEIKLILDNDNTSVTFLGEEENDDAPIYYLEDWLGNGPGVEILLSAIGIQNEDC